MRYLLTYSNMTRAQKISLNNLLNCLDSTVKNTVNKPKLVTDDSLKHAMLSASASASTASRGTLVDLERRLTLSRSQPLSAERSSKSSLYCAPTVGSREARPLFHFLLGSLWSILTCSTPAHRLRASPCWGFTFN